MASRRLCPGSTRPRRSSAAGAPGRKARCQVARQPGWRHVATYADQSPDGVGPGPGLARLLADAPGHFNLVLVDGYSRLSANRRELAAILDRLRWAGSGVVVLRLSRGRRLTKLVTDSPSPISSAKALADCPAGAGRRLPHLQKGGERHPPP